MALFFILTPCVAGAVTVFLGNTGYDTAYTVPGCKNNYYKCTNSATWSGCQSNCVQISYAGMSGGSGTSNDPYILYGCTFDGCACSGQYYLDSNKTCQKCPGGLYVVSSTDDNELHTISGNASAVCKYCKSNQLKIFPAQNVVQCIDCPEHGTCENSNSLVCDKGYYGTYNSGNGGSCTMCPPYTVIPGTTADKGTTKVTECYQAKGWSFYEESGQGKWTNDCHYTN